MKNRLPPRVRSFGLPCVAAVLGFALSGAGCGRRDAKEARPTQPAPASALGTKPVPSPVDAGHPAAPPLRFAAAPEPPSPTGTTGAVEGLTDSVAAATGGVSISRQATIVQPAGAAPDATPTPPSEVSPLARRLFATPLPSGAPPRADGAKVYLPPAVATARNKGGAASPSGAVFGAPDETKPVDAPPPSASQGPSPDPGAPTSAPEETKPADPPAVEEPAADAPIQVWQYARGSGDRVMLDLVMERGPSGDAGGVVVAQQIPAGWDIESSNPPIQAFDTRTRVAKWLVMDAAAADGHMVLTLVPSPGGANSAWPGAPAWYTYREANGTTRRIGARPHPDSR